LVEFSIEIDEEKPCDKAWHNRKRMQRSEQKSLAKTRTPRKILNLTHSFNSMKKKEKKRDSRSLIPIFRCAKAKSLDLLIKGVGQNGKVHCRRNCDTDEVLFTW
jgi:beta-lactamase regulating signal transducer with metallopeptidase domain